MPETRANATQNESVPRDLDIGYQVIAWLTLPTLNRSTPSLLPAVASYSQVFKSKSPTNISGALNSTQSFDKTYSIVLAFPVKWAYYSKPLTGILIHNNGRNSKRVCRSILARSRHTFDLRNRIVSQSLTSAAV